MTRVSHALDRIEATFDDPNLVANAGLLLVATLSERLGLEALIDATVRLDGRVGGARPGRKVLTLAHAMCAGGSHIDHADMLRAGATGRGVGASGDGPVDDRDVPAVVHVRALPTDRSRHRPRARTSVVRRCRPRRRGVGDRYRLDDLRSRRQRQARCRVRLHPRPRLSPDARHPGRHRRGAARPDAQRISEHPARRRPVHRRAHRPCPPRRGHRTVDRAGRFGVLVQRHDRRVEPARRALHDGRALRHERHC